MPILETEGTLPTPGLPRRERPPGTLVFQSVVAGYGGPPIVRGADAQVGPGEIVTVVGPNGAGKSTLLKAAVGLLRVQSGSIALEGAEIANTPTYRLARLGIGYVPQNDDVFAPLSVRENLEIGGYRMSRTAVHARIEEVATMLPALSGLLRRRAHGLSGGERKMVALGRALMANPRVLLLDEPTVGLAPNLASELLTTEIRALASAGVAVLLVEQRARAALAISDWGYVLSGGTTAISSAASELLARPDLAEVFLGLGAAAPTLEEPDVPTPSRGRRALNRLRR